MKIKISKTWIVIIIIVFLIFGYYVLKAALKDPLAGYAIEKVSKGEVSQEVSETGIVEATQNISLAFKSIGKISKISVSVGNNVKEGDVLAELDSSQILAQLQAARAGLDSADAQYNKLLTGLTPEDLKIYQNTVALAKQDLDNAYREALNTLNSAHSNIYNAYNTVVSLQDSYFHSADQEGMKIQDNKIDISNNMQNAKNYLDGAQNNPSGVNIDVAISQVILSLNSVFNSLSVIRNQCDNGLYYTKVPLSDKSSLDAQKASINTGLTSVTALQNNISSYKIALQKAEDSLSSETANARPEDIDVSQSQVEQAQANISALQSQLNDNRLISPINGKITEVNIKAGQVVSSSQPAINLLSTEPFQIKAAVYEQDIVNVMVGNSVSINLVAFPRQTFEGKILSIDPGETIIDSVVYYEVTIEFPEQPEGIRSGMTADIVIQTNKKTDALRIPRAAVDTIGGKVMAKVVNGKNIADREVEVGLEGNDYIEIISGLQEGDKIITGKR